MNDFYICDYAARLLGAPVRVYGPPEGDRFRCLRSHLPQSGPEQPLPPGAAEALLKERDKSAPRLLSAGRLLCCGAVYTPKEIYLAGPVRLETPQEFRLTLPAEENGAPELPRRSLQAFLQGLLLLHNAFHEIPLTEQQLAARNFVPAEGGQTQTYDIMPAFLNRENGRLYNLYRRETRLLESVEHGDLRQLEDFRQELLCSGPAASAPDRDPRPDGIAAVTLACHAAIRGGVHPETALSLWEFYLAKIEKSENARDVLALAGEAEVHFARTVHAIRTAPEPEQTPPRHPLVEKTKDYIYANLRGKLVLNDIAAQLNTNPCYLSELFKRHEGVSFTGFVLREKVELVKNLLLSSSASFGDIALALGFSSQSHLGKQFKKLTGMTLMQFRSQAAAGHDRQRA